MSSGGTLSSTGVDIVSNLSNLLPTGTFLAFQTLAPLFTNNGDCGLVEKIMTGMLVGFFQVFCFCLNFTDSITTAECNKVYYGIVTRSGLFSPTFVDSGLQGVTGMYFNDGTGRYLVNWFDLLNAILNVVTFSALSLCTSPITTCFYPNVSGTVSKCVPILVGLIVGVYFGFAPHARHGFGYALISGMGSYTNSEEVVPKASTESTASKSLTTCKSRSVKESLLGKKDNKDSAAAAQTSSQAASLPTSPINLV